MKRVDKRFVEACKNGDLENVKYFLTSKKFKINADIHADDDYGFKEACEEGHLEVVKYLLTSPDLEEHADIHANEDWGFRLACREGHLEVVKFLLTSPELKEHADIHARDDYGFQLACSTGHLEVVKFHVFDMNFQLSLEAIKIINLMDNKEEIFNMFDKRELERKLQSGLKVQEEKQVKRTKI